MKTMGALISLLRKAFRGLTIRLWGRLNASKGNVHLGPEDAILRRIPFTAEQAFLRPTLSDSGRVREYLNEIYFSGSYLHTAVARMEPRLLVDIGANIGLSSLSLLNAFGSLRQVIGIEAEKSNFEILSKNYGHWSRSHPDITFTPVHGAATASSTSHISAEQSLNDLTGENSASGTFRFQANDLGAEEGCSQIEAVSVLDLLSEYEAEEGIVMKIDIEGGEQYLMGSNTEWLGKVAFLTVEIHDRYHESLFESSRNLLKALNDHDFAIFPEKDVLHCYSRSLLRI